MVPRAHGLILGCLFLLVVALPASAGEATRGPPARPASPAAKPVVVPEVKTMAISDVAVKLGLKVNSIVPGLRVVLFDATRRVEFETDSRETFLNGLRVFLGHPVSAKRGQLYVSTIDYETCLVPLLQPSLLARPRSRPRIIAIDAGHGGVDQGTENHRLGFKEKILTLDVALRLKALLDQQGFVAVLTRATDVTVDKAMRVIIANRAAADVFVSIHFNALPNDQKTRGTEVFTFAPQYQRSTNSWSPLEPNDTERELSPANSLDAWNALLAHSMHRELLDGLKTFDRGKKIAHLGVLRGLSCPGVLVESGFLSNDDEARNIARPAYRQQIAVALAAGVQRYADQLDSLRKKS
ncbi:MAG: N-acetylmuramoyl-L-alanine amidase [Opitutus sp.]